MYDGKSSGRSLNGRVIVQGGSLAFCTQPPGGSITRGSSSYGWIVVQRVAEVSPGTTPDQNSQSPEERTGTWPEKRQSTCPSRSAYSTLSIGSCIRWSAASNSSRFWA